MRTVRGLLFVVLGLLIAVPLLAAEDDQPKKKRGQRPDAKRPEGGRDFAARFNQLLPDFVQEKLKLSTDQKDKLAKLQKEFDEKTKGANDKLREAMAKARENKDRDAMRKAIEDFRSVGKVREEFQAKVKDILTADQKKQLEEGGRGFGRLQPGQRPVRPEGAPMGARGGLNPFILQRLDLTKDQQEKIDKLRKELDDKIKGVLTDEQKKRLEELQKNPFGARRRPNQ